MIYAGSLATTKRRYTSELTANPTLVAIEELQLHDLQSIEAAVEVKQNANPAKHDEATEPKTPASGNDNRRPISSRLSYVYS